MPRLSQSTARRLAIRAVMLRPSTLTVTVSPIFEIQIVRRPVLERYQRLAGIVGGPPLAGDDAGTVRDGGCVGDAAVAAQHPARSRRRFEILRRDPVRRDDAAAQHRHALDRRAGRLCSRRRHRSGWRPPPGCRGRRTTVLCRAARRQFAMQVAVDLDHGYEQRETEAEREHHARRQRAGAVNVGDGQPQSRRALARQTARDPHRHERDRAAAAERRRRRRRQSTSRRGGRRSSRLRA